MDSPDVVFFVTPPERMMLGDYLETGRFRQCYPDLDVRVVQFNDPTSEVAITAEGAWLRQERCGAIDLHAAKAFVYFPCSFEPEDLALRPPDRAGEQGLYHHRQWRVVTSWIEHSLPLWGRCLNPPARSRAAANKLIQVAAFRSPLAAPPTWVGNDAGAVEFLVGRRAVAKNVSEGTFTGELMGDGDRLLTRPADARDGVAGEAPVVLQERIDAPVELRCYVIGEQVLTLELSRERTDEATPDIRAVGLHSEDVRLSEDWRRFDSALVACARRLALDYAVFDAIPAGDTLWVLEVNANGVWTGRTDAATPIRDAVHAHVAALV